MVISLRVVHIMACIKVKWDNFTNLGSYLEMSGLGRRMCRQTNVRLIFRWEG